MQVYPGASHCRFEHSLGVAYLAGCWGLHLLANYRPEGIIHREDRHNILGLKLSGEHGLGLRFCDGGAQQVLVAWHMHRGAAFMVQPFGSLYILGGLVRVA